MKKINFNMILITCVMCLLPILFGAYVYPELPEMVAIHFDINNNPDGFISREWFVFGLPIIMTIIQIFYCIMLDIKSKNADKNNKSLIMCKLIIPVLFVMLYVVIIFFAFAYIVDALKMALIILGVIFIVIGIDWPNTTDDSHINFPRINDEHMYQKTKNVFGKIFIIDGILSLIATLFNSQYLIVIVLLILIEAIGLLIFATWYNRKLEKKE